MRGFPHGGFDKFFELMAMKEFLDELKKEEKEEKKEDPETLYRKALENYKKELAKKSKRFSHFELWIIVTIVSPVLGILIDAFVILPAWNIVIKPLGH